MTSNAEVHHETTVSTRLLVRFVIVLIAMWSFAAGLVLIAFQGSSSGALGAGVTDTAGQRLVGAHLLVLVPAYLLIALRPERYQAFFWLPFAAQAAVVLVVGYDIVSGETAFGDGILPVAVGLIFIALLSFLWVTEQRSKARAKMAARQADLDADWPEEPRS